MLRKLTRSSSTEKKAASLRKKLPKIEAKRTKLQTAIADAIVGDDDAGATKLRADLGTLDAELSSLNDTITRLDEQAEAQRQAEADAEAAKQRQKKIARLSVLQKTLNENHAAIDEHLAALNELAQSQGSLSAEVRLLSKQAGVSVHPDFMLDANRLAYRLKCACWKLAPSFARAVDMPRTRAIHWKAMSTAADEKKHAA